MIECWFCGRKLMGEAPDLGAGWFRCECGATWIEVPKVAQSDVTFHGVPWSQILKGGAREARRLGLI